MAKPKLYLQEVQALLEEPLSHILGKIHDSVLARIVILGCFIILVQWMINYITQRVRGSRYVLHGPTVIEERYADAHGEPFVILTPSNRHVLVSSAKDIKELSEAPVDVLSLHAVAKENEMMAELKQGPTLRGELVNVADSCKTPKTNNLGATHLKVFPSIKRVVAKTNSLFFFGDELCRSSVQVLPDDADLIAQNSDFTNAALQYPQDVFVAGEAVRSVPRFLASFV
ncbi:MAG: hypothetical protein Q9221_003749 [Calogaya cf. arnoldii]